MPRVAKKNDVAIMYSIRIHAVDDGVNNDSITKLVSDMEGSYLMVKEKDANREHYQGWVISAIPEQTLRARIKKAFGQCVGNKAYSFKATEKPEDYMKYICKGTAIAGPEVVCKYGVEYTDEWIEEKHLEFKSHELYTAYELKKKKGSANEIIWERVEQYKDEVTPNKVVSDIIDVYTELGKPYDIFYVRRLRNVIMSKYDRKWRATMKQAVNADDVAAAYESRNYNGNPIVGEDGLDI